jgi:hypothetical protein
MAESGKKKENGIIRSMLWRLDASGFEVITYLSRDLLQDFLEFFFETINEPQKLNCRPSPKGRGRGQ